MLILQVFRCVAFASYILVLTPSLPISVQACYALLGGPTAWNTWSQKKQREHHAPSEKSRRTGTPDSDKETTPFNVCNLPISKAHGSLRGWEQNRHWWQETWQNYLCFPATLFFFFPRINSVPNEDNMKIFKATGLFLMALFKNQTCLHVREKPSHCAAVAAFEFWN